MPNETRYKARSESIRVAVAILLGVLFSVMQGASLNAAGAANSSQDLSSPTELVRAAVANEVAASNDNSIKHMFRSHKQTPQGSQTRLYVETRSAMAGMTVAYNDQPLAPEQMRGEENRLAGLVSDPEQLSRKHSQEQQTADRTLRIVKALPDAFLYNYDGNEQGTAHLGRGGDRLVRLKFRPNPAYEAAFSRGTGTRGHAGIRSDRSHIAQDRANRRNSIQRSRLRLGNSRASR